METPELPPDLKRLERLLAERERPEPPSDLKARIIGKMETELHRAQLPPLRPNGWWAFVATAAASLVFMFNLSSSAARTTSYDLRLAASPKSTDISLEQIQELMPELTQREALRYAVTLHAGSRLARCPDVGSSAPARRLAELRKHLSEGN